MGTFWEVFSFENIIFMLQGVKISLLVAVCGVIFGTMLGVIAAACKLNQNKFLRVIGNIYVELIRGTPMLLQLTFFYLGIPMLYRMITGQFLEVNALTMGILAISINSGAYSCELIRGAINSIDVGQWEAGKSLGLNRKQTMNKIILPQSFKRIIPPLANEFITLIKDSSLVSTIGVIDLMKTTSIIGAKVYNYFYPMVGAGLMYLVLTLVISRFTAMIERRVAESD